MPRLTYLPGILSLCLLWPLGTWYLWGRGELGRERCIAMTFPVPLGQSPQMDSLRVHVQDPIVFRCTGGLQQALPVLDQFRERMEELARTQSTDTLCVRFGPEATYATVMHAVESCWLNTRVWRLEAGELLTWYASLTPPPEPRGCIGIVVGFEPFCGTSLIPRAPTPWPDRGYAAAEAGVAALRPVWAAWPLFAMLVVMAWRGRDPFGRNEANRWHGKPGLKRS